MSSKRIEFALEVGGIAQALDRIVLRSEDGLWGVRLLAPPNTIITPADTDLEPEVVGGFEYVFTVDGLTAGLEYEYRIEYDFNGDTDSLHRTFVAPAEPVVVGKYVTQAYMELIRGSDNIRVWSRKGGGQVTTDTDAVAAAIAKAESRIDDALRARYVIPIATPMDAADVITLQRLAEPIASFELYRTRGLKDRDAVGKLLQVEYQEALDQLEEYADLTNSRILKAAQIANMVSRAPEIVL